MPLDQNRFDYYSDRLLDTGYAGPALTKFLTGVASVIEPVELHFLWRPQLADPSDEMVLEAAVNGRADMLVTHNFRDFREAAAQFHIHAATPREALEGMVP